MAGHKAPADFPVSLAMSLYDEFTQPGGRVLDPCHGWGGRYLGFLLSKNAVHYTGVDASPQTSDGLLNMHKDLSQYHNKSANFVCSPYEDTSIEEKYDFALTSPPYFDRETYQGGEQAHTRYATYDAFIEGFYKALIKKTYDSLKPGASFCLQVGNQKYDLDKKAKKIAKSIGFDLSETRDTDMRGMPHQEIEEIKEVILVFKKT